VRVGIDVRYLSHGLVGGVHTYVAHFVPALLELAAEHQVFLYADTKRPLDLGVLPDNTVVRYLPYRNAVSSVYLDLWFSRYAARDHLDVLHFPANYGFAPRGVRTVITVHDALNLLPLREIWRGLRDGFAHRTPRTVAMMTYLHFCTTAAVRRADLILTVSTYAGREIARYSGVDPQRIVPIFHAPTPDLRRVVDPPALAALRERYQLPKHFVLADAFKNPAAVVAAWRRLPERLTAHRSIVFFARRPEVLPAVRDAEARGEARVLLRPPREDLIALYSTADAFVFPSWTEGFGLPVLEAMSCGAPVVASDRGAIPEVAGDAALLAEATDPAALAQQLGKVLGSAEEAERLRRAGFARASQFSWRATARQILASYSRAVDADATASREAPARRGLA
jgi:glycosyltransferase involved in cell wall biosynthesis